MSSNDLTETHRRVVEQMYAAAQRGDVEGFWAPVSDDVVITEPVFAPFGGTHHGKVAFQQLTAEVMRYIDLGSMKVDQVLADGDRVVGFCRLTPADGAGEIKLLEALRLKSGVVVEMEIYYNDAGSLPLRSTPPA